MVDSELVTYLAGAGLGLTVGAGANVFSRPFPEEAPDRAVCVTAWGSTDALETMGDSLSAVAVERPLVKVIARDAVDKTTEARQLAHDVWKKLRRLDGTLSGTAYLNVRAESVQWLGEDEAGRPRFHFDLEVMKEESA